MKQLTFFYFLVLINITTYSQNYEITTSLVNNNNYSATLNKKLLLDDDGFLWYSTYNGLVKEMGSHSVLYEYAHPKEKNIITTYSLLKSSKNEIWASTNHGINVLNLDTGLSKWISTKYPNTENTVGFTSIIEDKKGDIWIGTLKNFVYCYTKEGDLIYTKIVQSAYRDVTITNRNIAAMNLIEVLDDNSIIIQQAEKWFIIIDGLSYSLFDETILFNINKEKNVTLIPNGSLFKENTSGTYSYKNKKYSFKYLKSINKHVVQSPYNTKLKYIPKTVQKNFSKPLDFISSEKSDIIALELKKDNHNYILSELDRFSLNKSSSNYIIDPKGLIYAHTQDGISKIHYKSLGFIKHLNNPKKYNSFIDISCRSFAEDSKGNIYVGTYIGLFVQKKGTLLFEQIKFNIKNKEYREIIKHSYNMFMLNDQTIYVYGYFNNLFKIDIPSKSILKIDIPLDNQKREFLIKDALKIDNKLYLSSSIGLIEMDIDTNQFKNVSILNSDYDISGQDIIDVHSSKNDSVLWIGTNNYGLYKYNRVLKTVNHYTTNSSDLKLVNDIVKVVYEDNENNVWIGTEKGLQKINPITLESDIYNNLNGLVNNNITGIQEDDKNIWASTYEGLVKINKDSDHIQSYFKEDGLPNNEFNSKSEFKSSDGTIFFGGISGLVSFRPEIIIERQENYKLILSEYYKFNTEDKIDKQFLNPDKNITSFKIPYSQNYITLKFAINDIRNPDKNKYQYRIHELGDKWIDLGSHNVVEIRGLQPNEYNIQVRAFTSSGTQTNTLSYTIKVEQIFYKRAWFITLYIFAIIAFLTIRSHYRRMQLKKEFNQKMKIQELESKAMRAQMNPHFIFNTLNGMQSVMILKGEREANKYFSAFSKLLRLTLDISNSEYVLIKDEITYLKSYLELENLRLNNRLNVVFNIDDNLDIYSQSIPCMLFQPIVENALIHGLSPKKGDLVLTISFKEKNGILLGDVTDNGIGREAAELKKQRSRKNHKSWATHIMNERIKISNSITSKKIDFEIIDLKDGDKPLGTKVTLNIPIKYMS